MFNPAFVSEPADHSTIRRGEQRSAGAGGAVGGVIMMAKKRGFKMYRTRYFLFLLTLISAVYMPVTPAASQNNFSETREWKTIQSISKIYGFSIKQGIPFEDQTYRRECNFSQNAGEKIYFYSENWKASGFFKRQSYLLSRQYEISFVDIVFIENSSNKSECYSSLSLKDLRYEEQYLIGARIEGESLSHKELPHKMSASFSYDWKTLRSHFEISVEAFSIEKNNKLIGSANVVFGIGGLDFIKLQQSKESNYLSLGLVKLEAAFTDKGILTLIYQELSKEQNQSVQSLKRDHYSSIESWRALFDPTNNSVIGATLSGMQSILFDGGTIKISFTPAREIKWLEFLNEQVILELLTNYLKASYKK
jgi:hypothetical protein